MKNLAKAISEVMKEIKGIDKNLNVGAGNNSYKGVADKDVKKIVGEAMAKNGLDILPIEIDPTIEIYRWEEETQYGKKQKQSVFTEVKTKYLLLHESGESQVISGYGHGVDSQDKSAGKATTYALKYALLYTFLVPTGHIDDADNDHSDGTPVPKNAPQKRTTKPASNPANGVDDGKPWLNKGDANWDKVVNALKGSFTLPQVMTKYKVSKANQELLLEDAAK